MHRRLATVIAFVFLAVAPAALGAGPSYVSVGGLGVRSHDGETRYVAVPTGNRTLVARISVADGRVVSWADDLAGLWGIPAPTASSNEGLTRDGRRLVVQAFGAGSPSRFAIVDTRTMRVVDRFTLNGDFAYDALSPDGSTLFLTQHVDAENVNRYVVRSYDIDTHELAPGRIADKTQLGWVMEGSALSRATTVNGRWVYTLFQRPGGYPFVHALDTMNGVAHCIGLPWHGNQAPLANMRLSVADAGNTLALSWKSGRTWLTMDTTSWRLSHAARPASADPWRWVLAAAAAGLLVVLGLCSAALIVRRRAQSVEREVAPLAL